MTLTAVIARVALGVSVAAGMNVIAWDSAPKQLEPELEQAYAKLPACAPIKGKPAQRAKSPDVFGAKRSTKTLKCFPKADVDAGKKLLNGQKFACFACHSLQAEYNPTVMLANLRAQGDGTLSMANITAVNAAHLEEMLGAVATKKQLKQVRAYLKVKFKG